MSARVADLPTVILDGAGLEGDPAEGAPGTSGLAPGQPPLLELPAARDILLGNGLDGLGMQVQPFPGGAGEVFLEFRFTDEAMFPLQYLHRKLIAVVPHEIDLASLRCQQIGVLVFQAEAQNSGRFHTESVSSSGLKSKSTARLISTT
jgi:hypothetical protein